MEGRWHKLDVLSAVCFDRIVPITETGSRKTRICYLWLWLVIHFSLCKIPWIQKSYKVSSAGLMLSLWLKLLPISIQNQYGDAFRPNHRPHSTFRSWQIPRCRQLWVKEVEWIVGLYSKHCLTLYRMSPWRDRQAGHSAGFYRRCVGTHQGNELARNFHGTLVRSLASSLYHSRLLLGLQEWHYRACADIHRQTKAIKQTNK